MLRPDLVVVQRAKSPMPLPGKLAALGIRYVEVEPGSLAEVYTLIQDIGRATGVETRAASLVGFDPRAAGCRSRGIADRK